MSDDEAPDPTEEETSPEVLRDLREGGAFLGGYVARPEARGRAEPPLAPPARVPWDERIRRAQTPAAERPPERRPERTPGASFESLERQAMPPRPAPRVERTVEPPRAEPPAASPGGSYDERRFLADIRYGRNRGPDVPGAPPRGRVVRAQPPTARERPTGSGPEIRLPDAPQREGERGYWFLAEENAQARGRAPRAQSKPASERDAERRAEDRARGEEARRRDFVEGFLRDNKGASEADASVAWAAAQRSSTIDTGD